MFYSVLFFRNLNFFPSFPLYLLFYWCYSSRWRVFFLMLFLCSDSLLSYWITTLITGLNTKLVNFVAVSVSTFILHKNTCMWGVYSMKCKDVPDRVWTRYPVLWSHVHHMWLWLVSTCCLKLFVRRFLGFQAHKYTNASHLWWMWWHFVIYISADYLTQPSI